MFAIPGKAETLSSGPFCGLDLQRGELEGSLYPAYAKVLIGSALISSQPVEWEIRGVIVRTIARRGTSPPGVPRAYGCRHRLDSQPDMGRSASTVARTFPPSLVSHGEAARRAGRLTKRPRHPVPKMMLGRVSHAKAVHALSRVRSPRIRSASRCCPPFLSRCRIHNCKQRNWNGVHSLA